MAVPFVFLQIIQPFLSRQSLIVWRRSSKTSNPLLIYSPIHCLPSPSLPNLFAQTFFTQSMEILCAYPIGVALLRRYFEPRLTALEWSTQCLLLALCWRLTGISARRNLCPVDLVLPDRLCFQHNRSNGNGLFMLLSYLAWSGFPYHFIHSFPSRFDTRGQLSCFYTVEHGHAITDDAGPALGLQFVVHISSPNTLMFPNTSQRATVSSKIRRTSLWIWILSKASISNPLSRERPSSWTAMVRTRIKASPLPAQWDKICNSGFPDHTALTPIMYQFSKRNAMFTVWSSSKIKS